MVVPHGVSSNVNAVVDGVVKGITRPLIRFAYAAEPLDGSISVIHNSEDKVYWIDDEARVQLAEANLQELAEAIRDAWGYENIGTWSGSAVTDISTADVHYKLELAE